MIIEIIGVGDAFSHQLGNTSFLAWEDDYSSAVLFECGHSVFPALRDKEIKENREIIDKIDSVFISHLHDDHCGSLCTMLEYRYWMLHKKTKVTTTFPFWTVVCGRMDILNATQIDDGEDERIKLHQTEHYDYPSCAACYKGLLYSGDTKESLLGTHYEREQLELLYLDDANSKTEQHLHGFDFKPSLNQFLTDIKTNYLKGEKELYSSIQQFEKFISDKEIYINSLELDSIFK